MESTSHIPDIHERMVTFEYACHVINTEPEPIREQVRKHWIAGTEIVLPNCKPEAYKLARSKPRSYKAMPMTTTEPASQMRYVA